MALYGGKYSQLEGSGKLFLLGSSINVVSLHVYLLLAAFPEPSGIGVAFGKLQRPQKG